MAFDRLRALALLCIFLAPMPVLQAQDEAFLNELVVDFEHETLDNWWNKDWQYRRKVHIARSGVAGGGDVIVLEQPDPLLLMNTERLRKDGADLRAVFSGGTIQPAGLIEAADPTRMRLWVRLPDGNGALAKKAGGGAMAFTLYYGNASASSVDSRLLQPEDARALLDVRVSNEEYRPGSELTAAPPIPSAFFARTRVLDDDDFIDDQGNRIVRAGSSTARRKGSTVTYCPWGNFENGPTGLGLLTREHRPQNADDTASAFATVDLPEAGPWYLHVRHLAGDKNRRPFIGPFDLFIGSNHWRIGEDTDLPKGLQWFQSSAEFEKGKHQVEVRMHEDAGLDCLILTRDPDYQPDVRDVSGRVWMRFRLPEDSQVGKHFFRLHCTTDTSGPHGASGAIAGFGFRDVVVPTTVDAHKLSQDPDTHLKPGQWSPWIEALASRQATWWSTAAACREHAHRPRPVRDTTIEYQFATEPDPFRVFRHGTEQTYGSGELMIRMPIRTTFNETLEKTRSFGDFAERRLARWREQGYPPAVQPERIFVTAQGRIRSQRGVEPTMMLLSELGFSGTDVSAPGGMISKEAFWQRADELGIGRFTSHHWDPVVEPWEWPVEPEPGESAEQAVIRQIEKGAHQVYAPPSRYGIEAYKRLRWANLGDEIGPATSPAMINSVPLLTQWYREFLRQQGITPEFLGYESWGQVQARQGGWPSPGGIAWEIIQKVRASRGLDPLAKPADSERPDLEDGMQTVRVTQTGDESEGQSLARIMEEEAQRQIAAQDDEGEESNELSEIDKRSRYWTIRFISHYTNRFYGVAYDTLMHYDRQGEFRETPMVSPNFQASPMMRTQMWNGAPNIFEWGLTGATNHLQMEDWIIDPYRVAFGMRVLRAAARTHDQSIGILIVGPSEQRYLSALSQGAESFLSYIFGPLSTNGPAWGDSLGGQRNMYEALDATGRHEKHLLASEPRPSRSALLFATTSDVNVRLGGYNFRSRRLIDRAAVFCMLTQAHLPPEVLSEEEILLDEEALARYDVLYVTDPHVRRRVQKKLHDWVEQGGTLWASYAALSRDEYDQPTHLFDEVFGLESRPTPQPVSGRWNRQESVAITIDHPDVASKAVQFEHPAIDMGWRIGTATPLGYYEASGKPAMLANTLGDGKAYLLGGLVWPFAGAYGPHVDEFEGEAARREVLAFATRLAGQKPAIETDSPKVLAFVKDSEEAVLAFVINCYDTAQEDVAIKVRVPWQPESLVNGAGETVAFEFQQGIARFVLDELAYRDGHLFVFTR